MNNPITYPQTILEVDLETSGLDPQRHGILEAAFHHPASGERWSAKVDPRLNRLDLSTGVEFEPAALKVNGCLTTAALNCSDRYSLAAFMERLLEWIETVIPTGQIVIAGRNPGFDWSFLEAAADVGLPAGEAAIFKARFSHRRLDTHAAVMALAIARGWKFGADRIDDLYRELGLEPEQRPHTAERGVEHLHRGLEAIVTALVRADTVNPIG